MAKDEELFAVLLADVKQFCSSVYKCKLYSTNANFIQFKCEHSQSPAFLSCIMF